MRSVPHCRNCPFCGLLLQHLYLPQPAVDRFGATDVAISLLSGPWRQQHDSAQHRPEPPPVQMSFRKEKPVVTHMFHQGAAVSDEAVSLGSAGSADTCGDGYRCAERA